MSKIEKDKGGPFWKWREAPKILNFDKVFHQFFVRKGSPPFVFSSGQGGGGPPGPKSARGGAWAPPLYNARYAPETLVLNQKYRILKLLHSKQGSTGSNIYPDPDPDPDPLWPDTRTRISKISPDPDRSWKHTVILRIIFENKLTPVNISKQNLLRNVHIQIHIVSSQNWKLNEIKQKNFHHKISSLFEAIVLAIIIHWSYYFSLKIWNKARKKLCGKIGSGSGSDWIFWLGSGPGSGSTLTGSRIRIRIQWIRSIPDSKRPKFLICRKWDEIVYGDSIFKPK